MNTQYIYRNILHTLHSLKMFPNLLLFIKELYRVMICHSHLYFLLLWLLVSLDGSLNQLRVLLLRSSLYNIELVQTLCIVNQVIYLVMNFLGLQHHYRNSSLIFSRVILHYVYIQAIHASQPYMFQILMLQLNIFYCELMTLQLVTIYFLLNL